jgi:hypothetical protein
LREYEGSCHNKYPNFGYISFDMAYLPPKVLVDNKGSRQDETYGGREDSIKRALDDWICLKPVPKGECEENQ